MSMQFCQCDDPLIRCDGKGCRCTRCGLPENSLPENPLAREDWSIHADGFATLQQVIVALMGRIEERDKRIAMLEIEVRGLRNRAQAADRPLCERIAALLTKLDRISDERELYEPDMERRTKEAVERMHEEVTEAERKLHGADLRSVLEDAKFEPADDSPLKYERRTPSPVDNPGLSIKEVMHGIVDSNIQFDVDLLVKAGVERERALDYANRWQRDEVEQCLRLIKNHGYKPADAVTWVENRRRNGR